MKCEKNLRRWSIPFVKQPPFVQYITAHLQIQLVRADVGIRWPCCENHNNIMRQKWRVTTDELDIWSFDLS